jgi:hypothetical protein
VIGELFEVDAHQQRLQLVGLPIAAEDLPVGRDAQDGLEQVVNLIAVPDVRCRHAFPVLDFLHLQPLNDFLHQSHRLNLHLQQRSKRPLALHLGHRRA